MEQNDHDRLIRLEAELLELRRAREQDHRDFEKRLQDANRKIDLLVEERRSFLWGFVVMLGTAVAGLISYIWINHR